MIRNPTRSTMALYVSLLVSVVMSLACAGCTERRRRPPVEAKALLERSVQSTATAPAHKLSFRFGDAVELIGFDLTPERIERGKPFTVTWHWKVDAPVGDGFLQFTHAVDDSGAARLNFDAQRQLFGVYAPSEWKAGEYILDKQTIVLPKDFAGRGLRLGVGFWRGNERLPVTRGAHKDNRVMALSRALSTGRAQPRPPTLEAPQRRGDIELNGKLDEPDWQQASWTSAFVNTMRGTRGSFAAKAKVLYDDAAMFVAFEVVDDFLKADHKEHDDHLWEQDTVEVMVDPDGDEKNYFEMQVSPRNVVFDTRYDTRRKPRPFGDVGWQSGLQSGVALRGTLDGEAGEANDRGYTVEMRIPWTAFAHGKTPAQPPTPGQAFAVNFFVMDARPSGGQRATGWSAPLVGDFHTLNRFGRVRFGSAPSAKKTPEATTAPPQSR